MIMTEAETLYAIHYYSYYYRFSYTPWNIIPKVDMGSIAEHGEFLQHQLIKFACCVLQESTSSGLPCSVSRSCFSLVAVGAF